MLSNFFTMQRTTELSLATALFLPLLLIWVKGRNARCGIVAIYTLVILHLTVGRRLLGVAFGYSAFDAAPQLDLTPFWSYARFDQADIRWQVYMNVFLFIPFGFMLPWASERFRKLWKVLLIAAIFSALAEAAQYFLRIGLCETDDVIHNTLGAALGYGYWRLLCRIRVHFRGDKK